MGFDIKELIDLVSERMNSSNPIVKNFLLSWLDLLCSIPNVKVLNQIPRLLPSLISYVGEKFDEIRIKADKQLIAILSQFEALDSSREVEIDENILKELAEYYKQHEFEESLPCRSVALVWTQSFLAFFTKDLKRGASVNPGIIIP